MQFDPVLIFQSSVLRPKSQSLEVEFGAVGAVPFSLKFNIYRPMSVARRN